LSERDSDLEISRTSNWTITRIVERSRRTTGARFPASFVRTDDGAPTLARLIQGGRGGGVRMKLYLSNVLLAGSTHLHADYGRNTIFDVSGRMWARALALPDPDHAGARRIADAQNQLVDLKLIELERRPSEPPIVRLRHPSGSGGNWVEPGSPYVRVPLEIWTNRWLWYLTGKELAVLIALIDLCGGKGLDGTGGPQALSGTYLRHYGMSDDTWRIASAALEKAGLIYTDLDIVGADLVTPRRRKRYKVLTEQLDIRPPIPMPIGG
jgi:hypothetical protein